MRIRIARHLVVILSYCSFQVPVFAQAPANDLCANAIDITADISAGNCVSGTTLNATKNVSGNYTYCGTASSTGTDVWYKFTTPASLPSCYTFNLMRGTATGELEIYMFTGDCTTQTLVIDKCECSNMSAIDFSSMDISASWAANTTYYLRVNNQNATGGTFSLCVRQINSYASNDECTGALTLGTGTNTFWLGSTGCTFSSNASDPSCSGGDVGGITAWFTFTASVTGNITVGGIPQADCDNGVGRIKMCLYKGSCGSLTNIGSSPGIPGQGRSGTTCNGGSGGSTTFSATAGTVYYAVVYAVSGSQNCRISLPLTNSVGPPLPVTLLNFNAVRQKNKEVMVAWATATEVNNDHFTIERSMDGEFFEPVGDVNGNGNSTRTIQYSLIDRNPYNEIISYYRLK